MCLKGESSLQNVAPTCSKQREAGRLAGNIPPAFRNVSLMYCVVSFNPAPDVLQEMNHCFIINQ